MWVSGTRETKLVVLFAVRAPDGNDIYSLDCLYENGVTTAQMKRGPPKSIQPQVGALKKIY